jgi:5'-3' exonuclease
MGIVGYYAFLVSKYPDVVQHFRLQSDDGVPSPRAKLRLGNLVRSDATPTNSTEYDHVYYDLNNFLYSTTVLTANSEEQIFTALYRQLDAVLHLFHPRKTVFLALDGPAPFAKFMTQRERRMKRAHKIKHDPKEEKETFDPMQFTPGTGFMQRLKGALCYYSCQRLLQKRYHDVHFYVSGADREGEGELKIFEHIAGLSPSPSSANPQKCLVVGNDADLILFALRSPEHVIVDVLKSNASMKYHLIDMYKLQQCVMQSSTAIKEQVLTDLVLISLFEGNDYLPKLRGFRLDRVWERYISAFASRPLFHIAQAQINTEAIASLLEPMRDAHPPPDPKAQPSSCLSAFHSIRSRWHL